MHLPFKKPSDNILGTSKNGTKLKKLKPPACQKMVGDAKLRSFNNVALVLLAHSDGLLPKGRPTLLLAHLRPVACDF